MSDWISIKDRLPEIGEAVIEWFAHEVPTVAYMANSIDGPRWHSYSDDEHIVGITHWMPLPIPPAAEQPDEVNCRGCWAFGNNCGTCPRCMRTRPTTGDSE